MNLSHMLSLTQWAWDSAFSPGFDKIIHWDAVDILEKLGKLILPKNCAFNLKTSLFLSAVSVAPFIWNTTLILYGNSSWMFVYMAYNWEIWHQFGK